MRAKGKRWTFSAVVTAAVGPSVGRGIRWEGHRFNCCLPRAKYGSHDIT